MNELRISSIVSGESLNSHSRSEIACPISTITISIGEEIIFLGRVRHLLLLKCLKIFAGGGVKNLHVVLILSSVDVV